MFYVFVGCFYRDKKNSKFIDMDFDNCINKFNKNDLSLDNLSFECRAVICENFHDVYSVR